ncbi:hypothetical protein TUM4641_17370 [Shewanella morhuae]|nr:hypothetical protein TUM4641_17370 [Shewanella morhuae]
MPPVKGAGSNTAAKSGVTVEMLIVLDGLISGTSILLKPIIPPVSVNGLGGVKVSRLIRFVVLRLDFDTEFIDKPLLLVLAVFDNGAETDKNAGVNAG